MNKFRITLHLVNDPLTSLGSVIWPETGGRLKNPLPNQGTIVAFPNCPGEADLAYVIAKVKDFREGVVIFFTSRSLIRKLIMGLLSKLMPRERVYLAFASAVMAKLSGGAECLHAKEPEIRTETLPDRPSTNPLNLLRGVIRAVRFTDYRVLKFMTVGLSGILVNESLLWLLVSRGHSLHIASPIAIETSITNNFVLNDLWTFRLKRTGRWIGRMLKYHLSTLLGALTNYVILLALTLLGLNYLVSNLIGIMAGFLVNYSFSEKFVWAKLSDEKTPRETEQIASGKW